MSQEQFGWLFNKARELMQKTLDPVHDWAHIERVLVNAQRIIKLLSEQVGEKLDGNIIKLAIVWHDVSYIKYRASLGQYIFESWRTNSIARGYFAKARLNQQETEFICDIILHHDWVEVFVLRWIVLNKKRSLYHQIVQDADTLDGFSKIRVAQAYKNEKYSLFKRVVMKILKPLFFDFLIRHKGLVYNLPEIISRLEKQTELY